MIWFYKYKSRFIGVNSNNNLWLFVLHKYPYYPFNLQIKRTTKSAILKVQQKRGSTDDQGEPADTVTQRIVITDIIRNAGEPE